MRELMNVLYVMTEGAVLHLEHDTVRVEVDGGTLSRIPLLRLAGIVVFGRVTLTPFLIQRCGEDGRSLAWLDRNGRSAARLEGRTRGNVLLRRAQHLALSDARRTCAIARQIVAAKIQNSRQVILRAARDSVSAADALALDEVADRLGRILTRLRGVEDLEMLRGAEGEAARSYFGVFGHMVKVDRNDFAIDGRSRRPPRDRTNALLSFLYALLRTECAAALDTVGLDPQIGYLHALRPGRPALALDLMEELRAVVADRLALTLINRRQIVAADFDESLGRAFRLTENGRRTVLNAYQERKQEEVEQRVIGDKVPLGLIPHIQARLLARHLRDDLADYPPFMYR